MGERARLTKITLFQSVWIKTTKLSFIFIWMIKLFYVVMGHLTVFSRTLLDLILWISVWTHLCGIFTYKSSFIFLIIMIIRTIFLIMIIIVRTLDRFVLCQVQKPHYISCSIRIFSLILVCNLLIVIIVHIVIVLILNILIHVVLIILYVLRLMHWNLLLRYWHLLLRHWHLLLRHWHLLLRHWHLLLIELRGIKILVAFVFGVVIILLILLIFWIKWHCLYICLFYLNYYLYYLIIR